MRLDLDVRHHLIALTLLDGRIHLDHALLDDALIGLIVPILIYVQRLIVADDVELLDQQITELVMRPAAARLLSSFLLSLDLFIILECLISQQLSDLAVRERLAQHILIDDRDGLADLISREAFTLEIHNVIEESLIATIAVRHALEVEHVARAAHRIQPARHIIDLILGHIAQPLSILAILAKHHE